MAPPHPRVVIDLSNDDDEFPAKKASSPQGSRKRLAGQQALNRSKKWSTDSNPIDISSSPERRPPSKERARGAGTSSQASDAEPRASKRPKHQSPLKTSTLEPRHGRENGSRRPSDSAERPSGLASSSKGSPKPRPIPDGSGPLASQKRARETEESLSDNGRPDKRQRSLKLGRETLLGSQGKFTSSKSPSNVKKVGSGEVIDLTSDTEEPETRVQNEKTAHQSVPNTDGSYSLRRNTSPKRQQAKSREESQRDSAAVRGKSPFNAAARVSKSSPLRRKSPRPSVPEKVKGVAAVAKVDDRRSEIPESLPGTPENDGAGEKRRLRDSTSPSKVAPAARARLTAESSPGPASFRNPRPLPLTPSESSADEDARSKRGLGNRQSQLVSTSHNSGTAPSAPNVGNLGKQVNSGVNAGSRQSSPAKRAGSPSVQPSSTKAHKTSIEREVVTSAAKSIEKSQPESQTVKRAAQDSQGPQGTSQPPAATASVTTTTRSKSQPEKATSASQSNAANGQPIGTFAATMGMSEQIEKVAGHCLDERRRDNEHWARTSLRRARESAQTRPAEPTDEPTSVFKQITPIATRPSDNRKLDRGSIKFETEIFGSKKKSSWSVPYTTFETDDVGVPSYSYFVKLKHNVLAPNEITMQHWPYFDDDTNSDPLLELEKQFGELYSLDFFQREKKLLEMLKGESFADYAEQMLRDMQCEWSDVLRFLLEPSPDVGAEAQAKRALQSRDTICDVASYRKTKRWADVLKKMPTAVPKRTAKAALLCEHFKKLTGLSFWHVVRRSDYTRSLLEEMPQNHTQDELTCRVCFRFSCPYHGEIENPDDDSDSETSSQGTSQGDSQSSEAVATDIVNPPTVNYRSRVGLPETIESGSSSGKDRRSLSYWQSGSNSTLLFKADARNPFYPCHHPGQSCSGAQCSCHTNKIACEKSCACAAGCPRKFQGCNCQSKGKVCFNNDNCACFQLGRECDPDLCGDCGVCDVLNPVHRQDDRVLTGRCRNANIQRGVPKHTMIGKSELHGFGLYACENIREHDFIGEYKGELITTKEAERRGAVYEHQKLSYLFQINQSQEVDSTFFGNKMRFINHATKLKCNVYARIITVNTVHRIGLYAHRDIRAGEELAFDYGPRFTFAGDQQGAKRGGKQREERQSKAVPHVRNANITKSFWDPEGDGRTGTGSLAAQKSLGRPTQTSPPRRSGTSKVPRLATSSSDLEMMLAEEDDEDGDYTEPDEEDD